MVECAVRATCQTAMHCPWCVEGSEYTPVRGGPLHPAVQARHDNRRIARRLHRALPAVQRGARNRRHGQLAERRTAHQWHGVVNRGSGRFESRPNDVYLPGWQLEVRERLHQFGSVWRVLQTADGLWVAPGMVIIPGPIFDVHHPATPNDSWTWPETWTWHYAERLDGWTTLWRWVMDPREHPDAVVVRTTDRADGSGVFVAMRYAQRPGAPDS